MFKKFFTIVGVLSLVCFSFYYTDLATKIIKNNDPIMKEIIKVSEEYKKDAVNAVFEENSVIPGISGFKVDIDKSYSAMKKYGSFNNELIVFEEIIPSVSITNSYDKYIRNGNFNKKEVSLIITVDDYSYLENIIYILNSKDVKATFFVNKNILDESFDIVKLIVNSKHQIEVKSDSYTQEEIKKYNNFFKENIKRNMNFCYVEEEKDPVLSSCSKNNIYTVFPSIITTNFPYSDVKSNLKSGSIISLRNNQHTLRELKYIVNYIIQRGYKIVTLEELIKE